MFDTPHWGKGLASSVVKAIVQTWAPEVRRLGGDDQPEALRTKFRCFGGAQLSCLDATASPDNVGSWKSLRKNGFVAAQYKIDPEAETVMDLDGRELDGIGTKAAMVALYDAEKTPAPLTAGTRYKGIDPFGKPVTFSFIAAYAGIRYHFENNTF